MKLPTLILKENKWQQQQLSRDSSLEPQIQLPEVSVDKVKVKDVKHSMYHKKAFTQVKCV